MNAKEIFKELGCTPNRPDTMEMVLLKLSKEVIGLRKRVSELERSQTPQTFGEQFRALIGFS